MYTSGAVTRFELHIYDQWGSLISASGREQWVNDIRKEAIVSAPMAST